MLLRLSIQNYAIIDRLDISFSGKLNIITGETGAGKSIIMGALGLILGERADSGVLLSKEKKSVVEGVFDASRKKEIREFLEREELDITDELFIRREIAVNGKSRAFINDTPVNLASLTTLSSLLVDLHQQFDTLELGDSGFQRDVMDALANNTSRLESYQEIYMLWQLLIRQVDELKLKKQQFDREADYHQFQYNELEEAGFGENELEEIETELKLLTHAESIRAALDKAYYDLEESDAPLVQQLKSLVNQLNNYSNYHQGLSAIVQRLQTTQIEVKDIATELAHINSSVNYDPARAERLNERLSLGYRLQKKHGVNSTRELLDIQKQLEEKLQAVLNIDEEISDLERKSGELHKQATELALHISKARREQAKPLETNVNKLLTQVGMPNARLKVEIKDADLGSFGSDAIEFLFDANKSGQFQPIRKVASGGELSRLMLCIKSLVAQSMDLPTMIFDEIDTGISGEAARQVGVIMKGLASKRQVICITHQPQIAGRADAHFYVYKEIVKDVVKTNIRQLTTDERITVIAKMLSGEKPTAAAMENAKEMLAN